VGFDVPVGTTTFSADIVVAADLRQNTPFTITLPNASPLWGVEMTTSEHKVIWRGVAAGTITGVAVGLMVALFIAIR